MRHFMSALAVFCLLFFSAVPSFANEDRVRVFDYADLLTEEEEQKLNELCLGKEDALETELYILTTDDTGGKETVDFTDDFGDDHAFGYDKEYGNYMILCIDMQNRIVWLSTSGKAEMYFTEERIDALLDDLYADLKAGNYYATCYSYIQSGEKYLSEKPVVNEYTTDPDRYKDTIYKYDKEPEPYYMRWYFRLAVSAAVGAIVVAIMSYRAKTHMTVNGTTYSRNGAQVYQHSDSFIRRTTSSRRIESNHSSSGGGGGGGGHHTSSGGHSHGGGGRSF